MYLIKRYNNSSSKKIKKRKEREKELWQTRKN